MLVNKPQNIKSIHNELMLLALISVPSCSHILWKLGSNFVHNPTINNITPIIKKDKLKKIKQNLAGLEQTILDSFISK